MASDLSLLKSAVTDVLGLSGKAAEDNANAAAQAATAAGNTAEASSYEAAIGGANEAATLEGIAGNIRGIQEQRKVGQTLATQRADIAANGFSMDSGSSIALLRASLQQGYLSQQLNDVQTGINRGGYLEQAAASASEQAAATAAAKSATDLGAAYTSAGTIATANAASETDAIQKMLLQDYVLNGPLTPQQQATQDVVTSALKSPLNGPMALPASAVPSGTSEGAMGISTMGAGGVIFSPVSPAIGIPLSSRASQSYVPRDAAPATLPAGMTLNQFEQSGLRLG